MFDWQHSKKLQENPTRIKNVHSSNSNRHKTKKNIRIFYCCPFSKSCSKAKMAPLLEGFFGIECGSDLILKSKRKKGKKVGKKKGFGKITNMSIQKYVVVYEYEARYDTELDLYKDEVIMLLGSEDGGWSEGKNDKGKQGWFPTTFVAPFSSNPNSLSNPSIASSSPTPITRHDSRSSVSVLKGTKDDTLADKKKKRSLFTKSMKLTVITPFQYLLYFLFNKYQIVRRSQTKTRNAKRIICQFFPFFFLSFFTTNTTTKKHLHTSSNIALTFTIFYSCYCTFFTESLIQLRGSPFFLIITSRFFW